METVCAQCECVVGASRHRIKDFDPASRDYRVITMCPHCVAERASLRLDPHMAFVLDYTAHRHCEAEFAQVHQPAPKGARPAGEGTKAEA